MAYYKPSDLEDFFRAAADTSGLVRYMAGGTDLMHRFKKQFLKKEGLTLLDINDLSELKGISEDHGSLQIAALTTLSELLNYLKTRDDFVLLKEALSQAACPQIRNRGTIGGHLSGCLPPSHLFPALMIYGASVEIIAAAEVRSLPVEDLFKQPYHNSLEKGELIRSLTIPKESFRWTFYWGEGERKSFCFAPFVLAMGISTEGGYRLAGGALKKGPVRFRTLEKALKDPDCNLQKALAAEFQLQDKAGNPLSEYQKTLLYRFTSEMRKKEAAL